MRVAGLLSISGAIAVSVIAIAGLLLAQDTKVKSNEIGGVVTSSKGPEAGVWVIAETNDTNSECPTTAIEFSSSM